MLFVVGMSGTALHANKTYLLPSKMLGWFLLPILCHGEARSMFQRCLLLVEEQPQADSNLGPHFQNFALQPGGGTLSTR